MKLKNGKKPLYRKVNTKTRFVRHNSGGDNKYERHLDHKKMTKMKKNVKRGLDYTPLYKFLLSKVGHDWDKVFSEASSRLDSNEPIFNMVQKVKNESEDCFIQGESSYFSTLYIDENNTLQIVNPKINEHTEEPCCSCCTHTFNGKLYTKKFKS